MRREEIIPSGYADGDGVAVFDQQRAAALSLLRECRGFVLVALVDDERDGGLMVKGHIAANATEKELAFLLMGAHESVVEDIRKLIGDRL